jgi:Flp pilus assembly protein TadB
MSIPWRDRPGLRVLTAPARHRAHVAAASRVARDVPLVVDLVAVALGAGTTPALAVARVAPWAPPTVQEECRRIAGASARGERFVDACADGARRQPLLAPLLDALAVASVEGGAVTPTLTRLAATARDDARRAAEMRARAVPVRLLFPLVITVLPAFVLLTVAPVVFGVLVGH